MLLKRASPIRLFNESSNFRRTAVTSKLILTWKNGEQRCKCSLIKVHEVRIHLIESSSNRSIFVNNKCQKLVEVASI